MDGQPENYKRKLGFARGGGKLAARFRRLNIFIYAVAFCIIASIMILLLGDFITKISSEYPAMYATSSAEALSAHISRELGLVTMLAYSEAIVEWMTDENDDTKRDRAFREMATVVGELYSFNLYVGIAGSLNEYQVETGYMPVDIELIDVLKKENPNDAWYFTCMDSEEDYIIEVGIDDFMQRKRVFLNYKVVSGGMPLGVLATGLEFSHIAGELFSHYGRNNMRGLIVDSNGVIIMDSSLMSDREFLYSGFEAYVHDEFTDPGFIAAFETYLDSIDEYFKETGNHTTVRMRTGLYRYATIMPVRNSNWSIIIFSGGSSLFDISYFIPMLATLLGLLIAIALVISIVNYRLLFLPMKKISGSLVKLRDNLEERVYGVEREDELGDLSKTIQDLFTIAHKDALTGIYNRRFMENNLEHIMGMLSRTQGMLSVMMLDIDYFKRYNDAFGHDQGDVCLRQVANALAGTIGRTSDFVARYGGEEFIAILTNTDEEGARFVAEKLLENVRALNIGHPGNEAAPCVTVSIGVATGAVGYGQKWEEYVKRADEALYMSKQGGRNRYTYQAME